MRYLKRGNRYYQVTLEKLEQCMQLSFTWGIATSYIIGSNLGYEIFDVNDISLGFVFNLTEAVDKCIDLIDKVDKAEHEMRQFYIRECKERE